MNNSIEMVWHRNLSNFKFEFLPGKSLHQSNSHEKYAFSFL